MHLFLMFEFHFTKLPLRVENGSTADSQHSMLQWFNDVQRFPNQAQRHQMKDGNLIILIQFAHEGAYVTM